MSSATTAASADTGTGKPTSAADAKSPSNQQQPSQFDSMSVKQLKQYLADRGVDTSDCLEKLDFIAKAKSAPAETKSSAAGGGGSSAAAAVEPPAAFGSTGIAGSEGAKLKRQIEPFEIHTPISVGPYTFSGPLTPELKGECINNNPYDLWEKYERHTR